MISVHVFWICRYWNSTCKNWPSDKWFSDVFGFIRCNWNMWQKKSITVLDCMHKSIISIVTWRSIVLELIQRRLHTHLSLHSIFHANEQTIVGESVLQLIFFHYHLNYIECTDNCLTCDFLSNWLNLTLKHWTWHAHFIGKLFKTKKENTYLLCVRKSHQLQ